MGEIGVVQIFLIKTQVSDVVVENIFAGSSVKIVEQRRNLRLVKIAPVFFRKVKSCLPDSVGMRPSFYRKNFYLYTLLSYL